MTVFPPSTARGLPGNLVEAYRAGIIAINFITAAKVMKKTVKIAIVV
jgi:hypothetical protein